MKTIIALANRIVLVFGLCISGTLLSLKLFYSFNVDTKVYSTNFFASIFSSVLFIVCLIVFYAITSKIDSTKHIAITCCILISLVEILFCLLLVIKSRIYFSSDAGVVYNLAIAFSKNDFAAITPKDSYMSIYPQQYGIIFIFETLMKLCNTTNGLLIQLINIIFVVVGSLSTLGIAWEIYPKRSTLLACTLLQLTFFPLFFYVPVAYGDLPGTQLILMAFYCTIRVINRAPYSHLWIFFAFLCFISASLYKRNTIICLIAVILCCIVELIRRPSKKIVCWLVLTTILSLYAIPAVQKIYEVRSESSSGRGIPMATYIAMSMQEGLGAPGAWSGYHTELFLKNNYDHESTSRQALQDIEESLKNFAQNPPYAFSFYKTKIAYQWTEGTFDSINWGIGNAFSDTVSPWIQSITNGKLHSFFVTFSNCHQCILYIYLFAFILISLYNFKNQKHLPFPEMILIVTIIGGFLFELIWESSSRYVLMYYATILPLAACASARITSNFIHKKESD